MFAWRRHAWLSHSFLLGTKVPVRNMGSGLPLDFINFYKVCLSIGRSANFQPWLLMHGQVGLILWCSIRKPTILLHTPMQFTSCKDNFFASMYWFFCLIFWQIQRLIKEKKGVIHWPLCNLHHLLPSQHGVWRVESPGYPSCLCCSLVSLIMSWTSVNELCYRNRDRHFKFQIIWAR